MRWKSDKAPEVGDRRIVSKFLLVPRTFGTESRWLERTEIVEQFQPQWPTGRKDPCWKETGFASETERVTGIARSQPPPPPKKS